MELEMLRHLAAKTGLSLNYISKDEKVSYLLSQIWEIFGESVILKGGTALNRVYLSKLKVSRFSEDIDLDCSVDYFGHDLDENIRNIKAGMQEVRDFDVSEPKILHRTLRFDCHYINQLGNRDRVRVEFYLSKPPFVEAKPALVKSPFVDSYPTIFRVYSLEDLLARKLIALHNRMDGKDIYDIFYALKLDFDMEKFENALKLVLDFYRIDRNFFENVTGKLDEARKNARYIGNSTNHFIPRYLRPNWVEMIESLKGEIEKHKFQIGSVAFNRKSLDVEGTKFDKFRD